MEANMWKNSLENVESDNNKILYETLLDFFLQRNGTYFLNKPRILLYLYRYAYNKIPYFTHITCNIQKYCISNCPTRFNTKQSIRYPASSLSMFRMSNKPITRSTQNCNYSLRYLYS